MVPLLLGRRGDFACVPQARREDRAEMHAFSSLTKAELLLITKH